MASASARWRPRGRRLDGASLSAHLSPHSDHHTDALRMHRIIIRPSSSLPSPRSPTSTAALTSRPTSPRRRQPASSLRSSVEQQRPSRWRFTARCAPAPSPTRPRGPSADPPARRTQTACRRVAARDGVLHLLNALAEGGDGWTEACRSDPAVQRETTRISASSSPFSLSRSRLQRLELMLSSALQSRPSYSSPAL